MPSLQTIVTRLFSLPGGPTSACDLLLYAATAHRHLFQQECLNNPALRAAVPSLTRLCSCDRRPALHMFCHPAFLEGLHRLSPICARFRTWHNAVALPSSSDVGYLTCDDFSPLGAMELTLQIHDHCLWQRPLSIKSDMFGRLHFPQSDWNIALRSTQPGCDYVLADEPIEVSIDRHLVRWWWKNDEAPFLIMPEETCWNMLAGNSPSLTTTNWCCQSTQVMPVIDRASPLCEDGVRYEQTHIIDSSHAKTTAEIIRLLHNALRSNSPTMHQEFCALMTTIRGFELPLNTSGTVQSFSDPSLPGIMNLNIPYDDRHEPHLSPFCFTWLAHELAHTKFYLVNDIAFDHGWTLVKNSAAMTDVMPRYARPLPIRTLIQIPYTHIYEWELLMDFLDHDLDGIPWDINENPFHYGEDLKCEIEEAFALIDEFADLTPLGVAAFSQFSDLFDRSLGRWRAFVAA